MLALVGPLGAGKTLFAKALAEGLGVPPGRLASPSFVIASEIARPGGLRLVHADLYRVESEGELEAAGWLDWLEEGTLVVVEWADRLPGALPPDHLEVRIEPEAGGPAEARRIAVRAGGSASEARRERWRARLGARDEDGAERAAWR